MHPYLAEWVESQLERWKRVDLPDREATGWAAINTNPDDLRLAAEVRARNAQRRAERPKEKR